MPLGERKRPYGFPESSTLQHVDEARKVRFPETEFHSKMAQAGPDVCHAARDVESQILIGLHQCGAAMRILPDALDPGQQLPKPLDASAARSGPPTLEEALGPLGRSTRP